MDGKNVSADLKARMDLLGQRAVAASRAMGAASPEKKAEALKRLAALLRSGHEAVFAANAVDIAAARQAGMDAARLDRLTLTSAIMEDMACACEHVANMPDPIGAMDQQWQRPNGLLVGRMRVPLGVVAMIYESRPNVTIDAAILCLKAGNAVILRGGSEAFASNMALAALLAQALKEAGLPADAAQVVDCTDRAVVSELCAMDRYIDVLIPRGGEGLVRRVCAEATMPVLKHFMGVCHMYVDESADADMAVTLARNGKVQRPGVCNALECLLVHRNVAETVLPRIGQVLGGDGVTFRACPRSLPLLGEKAEPQQPGDLGCEFHALVLAVRVVDSLDEALNHIAQYGSHHTEVICTQNHANAMRFLREADASMVAVNASTRFNDGGQLGLGAEIGISTSKLHAYGPMGVRELTTTKFVVFGSGQVRR
ncbi:MAG: glutamate-5-semialdehyde dehydrogenase [Desulfovibrionaceae bacterium]|nr:glutamate-5-semialdehyde dehydrogenase [Desulfovibrionaceae bacterium]